MNTENTKSQRTGNSTSSELPFSEFQLDTCLEVLQQVAKSPEIMDHHDRFKSLVRKIHREGKRGRRDRDRATTRMADKATIDATGIVRNLSRNGETRQTFLDQEPTSKKSTQTDVREFHRPRGCYVCKEQFTQVHHFYHQLCPVCAEELSLIHI